ncbi:UNVERIFIED_CONTAM: Disease resistance protein RGA5 [Sesamum calycinum]|uniref:Disease resistance protein RGA5 n=1 Tax=Sesamum calycinum TaxID=2727403 RepID=A0AAW2J4R7_9LAMI
MAYADLVSLKHTIERLLSSSQIPSHPPSQELIQVAYNVVKSLQELFTTLEEDRDNEMVKAMNKDIREAACRLEDVLDQAHQPNHHFLSQSETLDGDLVNEVLEEIDFFTRMVKKIRMQLSNYSLPEEDGTVNVPSRIDQYFGLKEQKIIGFARDLNMLRHYVIEYPYEDPERLVVLAVDGMAGIGKTTLVTGVYLDPLVVSHFDCRAFVSIGPKYQLRGLLLCIIAQINPEFDTTSRDAEITDDEELASYLCSCLKNRRYLIVVDDLWKTQVWDELEKAFPDDLNKSRVMVTSRLYEVAKHASTDTYPHRMRFLNKEESWHLLRDKVFGGEENSCPPQLHKAGREIAVKCQGLPLMIIALAKHLSRAEKTAEYWEKVAEKEYWDIIAADEEMFKIRASKLTRLWCAEGFLESTTTQKLEHYAAKCLDELCKENVVQQCDFRFSSFAIIKICKLHPAFLHLCMRENGKDKLFHVVSSSGNQGIESQRRFCMHNNVLFGIKGVRELMASVSNARSLLCFGPHHSYPVPVCFGSFNLLRVLDALTMRFYGFPNEVTVLVKLRYFAFTYNGKIPASISKLQNLEYLIVHQYLSIVCFEAHRWYLPIEIWKMQQLRHLEVIGSDLPKPSSDIACLPNLLTLSGISTHSCKTEVLERIPNLVKLGVQIRSAADNDVVESLSGFDCLTNLDQLDTLKCCVTNPKHRSQVGISVPPRAPIFPSNIRKLTLSGLGFSWEYMSTIAQLRNLRALKLRCNAFQGQDWTTYKGELSKLRYLLLEDIDLRYWTAHSGKCFPRLRDLTIRHCYKLESIPPRIGYKAPIWIRLVDCNPRLVAYTKEQILEKEEDRSQHIRVYVDSSVGGGSQCLTNAPGKLISSLNTTACAYYLQKIIYSFTVALVPQTRGLEWANDHVLADDAK